VAKLKKRFALDHVVLVGDRGMITQARIDEDLRSGAIAPLPSNGAGGRPNRPR